MDRQLYRTVNLIIFIFYFVSSDYGIDYIPYIVSFFWGILILVWDFFTERVMFKQPYWYILFAFCISYVISILTNFPTNLVPNGMNLVYLAIQVFIFYAVDPKVQSEKRDRQFQRMNDVYIVLTFVLALISIGLFVFNISYVTPEGQRQGFIENRLFGLFTSPNIGGMFGYLSCLMMLANNYFKRGSWKKFQWFYIFNGVVQYLYFVLARSRGTRLAIIGLLVFLFIMYALKIFHSKEKKIQKTLLTFLVIMGAYASFDVMNEVSKVGLSYVPGVVNNLITPATEKVVIDDSGNETTVQVKEPIKKVVIENSAENLEVSAGRFTIWEAGLQLVKQRPLFGVADSYVYRSGELSTNIDEAPLSEMNKRELRRIKGNLHNTYLAVLVKSGVVGFLILMIFVFLILKDNYKFLMDKRISFNNESIRIYVIMLAFLLSLFVNELVENHLVFNNRDVMGLVFWSYLGFLNHFRLETMKKLELQ